MHKISGVIDTCRIADVWLKLLGSKGWKGVLVYAYTNVEDLEEGL